ncbi:MAG TPA: hypothetical protein VJ875_26000 [Pyrinomonadaceae bacterium]|nr:hypothetical protein [Pyrinomonadaceae bacterium]
MNKTETPSIGPFAVDEALRAEADVLLYELGLKKLIEEYAPVHITGSYALQLMVWRDLDIMMNAPGITVGQFFDLGKRITVLLAPWKMFFTNSRENSSNDYPSGLYWGIRMGDIKRGAWKIDLWAFDSDQFREKVLEGEALKSRLTEKNRLIILDLKGQLWDKPEYRDTITSQDIYAAVLDREVKTLDEFFRFIKKKR